MRIAEISKLELDDVIDDWLRRASPFRAHKLAGARLGIGPQEVRDGLDFRNARPQGETRCWRVLQLQTPGQTVNEIDLEHAPSSIAIEDENLIVSVEPTETRK